MDKDILGLSCVENHVLDFIKPRCENFGLLYYDCFVSSHDVFETCKIKSFEYYDGVDRIQDVLEQNEMLEIEMYRADFISFLNHLHKNQCKNIQVLMRVDAVNAQKKFFARGLRNDHYISVHQHNEYYLITNDIPYKMITVSAKELGKLFAGYYLVIKYKDWYSRMDFDFINQCQRTTLCDIKKSIDPNCINSDGFIDAFINMLVIIRIMRQRLFVFLCSIGVQIDLSIIARRYTKILTQAEYIRLRNTKDTVTLQKLLQDFNQTEIELFEEVSNVYKC